MAWLNENKKEPATLAVPGAGMTPAPAGDLFAMLGLQKPVIPPRAPSPAPSRASERKREEKHPAGVTPVGPFKAFDTETYLIPKNSLTPPMVCLSYRDEVENKLLLRPQGLAWARSELVSDTTLVAHNGYFDYAVITNHEPDLFERVCRKFQLGQIKDTQTIAQLVGIRYGWLQFDPESGKPLRVNLGELVKRFLGKWIEGKKGEDSWRLRYGELDGVPLEQWPEAAYQYALLDSHWCYELYTALRQYWTSPDEVFQHEVAWWLHLAGCWGLTHDPVRVEALEEFVFPIVRSAQDKAIALGLMRPRVEKVYMDKLYERLPEGHPKTAGGKPSLNAESILGRKATSRRPGVPGVQDELVLEYFRAKGPTPALRDAGLTYFEEPTKDTKFIKTLVFDALEDLYEKPFEDWTFDEKKELATDTCAENMDALRKQENREITREEFLVKTDRETLKKIANDKDALGAEIIPQEPRLVPLLTMGEYQTLKSTFLPKFKDSIEGGKICPHWNPLVSSGRVSVSAPNVNNQPKFPGVRECHAAREGYGYIDSDYEQIELCALAQACLILVGWSQMAEAINDNKDLHIMFAAKMLRITYEEAWRRFKFLPSNDPLNKQIKEYRQRAKAANFGFPGGLGAKKFVKYALQYNVKLTLNEALELREDWLNTFPEVRKYFLIIDKMVRGSGEITQLVSGRIRGGLGYTDGCNTVFQGLTADGAKRAVMLASRDMYLNKGSALYLSRLVAFIYDEMLIETPLDRLDEAGKALDERMIEGMSWAIPDVKVKCEAVAMTHWSKNAFRLTDPDTGKLICWEPLSVPEMNYLRAKLADVNASNENACVINYSDLPEGGIRYARQKELHRWLGAVCGKKGKVSSADPKDMGHIPDAVQCAWEKIDLTAA